MSPLSHARWARRCAAWSVLLTSALASRLPAAEQLDPKHREASYAVSEALQREIYGLEDDRRELLDDAAERSPQYAPARWHLGFLRDERRGWLKFDEYLSVPKVAHLLAKYERERSAAADTAAGQLVLADWCAENGLAAQERAHLTRVIELNPDHAAARQRMGFVREGREWISRQEIAREQTREQAGKAALAKWKPTIAQLREGLEHRSLQKREFSAQKLREIREAEAIGAIEQVFRGATDEVIAPAIETLAGISDPEASLALAWMAVYWPTPAPRQAAAEKLAGRERDTYVPQLLASMFSPVISRFVATSLPRGRIGYRHTFVREGDDERQVMVLDTEYRRVVRAVGKGQETAARALEDAQAAARSREATVAAQNRMTNAINERLMWVLATATGEKLPPQPEAWWAWWNEQNEVFVASEKKTSVIRHTEQVAVVDYVPENTGGETNDDPSSPGSSIPRSDGGRSGRSASAALPVMDCLAAGTPVWTARGPVAIDQIRLGDLVLAQHADSGELAYKPVLRTTIRPSGKLIKVETSGGESFQTSGGHLFWVAGEGWTKSRNLKSGQVLHTASGPVHVSTVEDGSEAQTYNLVVADFSSYFVGQAMVLSHDNTVRLPTRSLVPGLRAQ